MTAGSPDYRSFFHDAPFGYVITDRDGTIRQVSSRVATWLGAAPNDLTGTPLIDHLVAGSGLFFETRHKPTLLLQGRTSEVALTLIAADGREVEVLANFEMAGNEGGSAAEVRVGMIESSERRSYERKLLHLQREAEELAGGLQVLQAAAASFLLAGSQEDVASALVESVIRAFDASSASVFRHGPDESIVAVAGEERIVNDGSPVEQVMRTGIPVVLGDLDEAEQRFPPSLGLLRKERIEALMVSPISQGDMVLGALLMTFGRPRRLDDAALRTHIALTSLAAHAIARLDLQEQLELLARHDVLTGLPNRQAMHRELEEILETRSARDVVAAIFLDLDGFKQINDRLGHDAGDSVLREVASRLRQAIRTTDRVYRLGGDEFLISTMQPNVAGVEAVAERVRRIVGRPFEGIEFHVTTSIGIAVLSPGFTTQADALITLADGAMYQSKAGGGDRATTARIPT